MGGFGAGLWGSAEDFVIELAEQHADKRTPNSQPKSTTCLSADHWGRQANARTVEATIKEASLEVRNLVLLNLGKFSFSKTDSTHLVSWGRGIKSWRLW